SAVSPTVRIDSVWRGFPSHRQATVEASAHPSHTSGRIAQVPLLLAVTSACPFSPEVIVMLLAHSSRSQKYSPLWNSLFWRGRHRRWLCGTSKRKSLPPRR